MRAGTLGALDLHQPSVEFDGNYAVLLRPSSGGKSVREFLDFIASRFAPNRRGAKGPKHDCRLVVLAV